MITLQNLGDSILFTFDENDKYLNNGTISVPMNSLILVTDDSEMATFRKAATNDIFVSALYSDFGMTKAELEEWYAENMVSEVTEEDVDEKIAEAVGEETDRAISAETALSGAIDAVDAAYKAADSVISGAVDNLSTALQNESQRAVSAETALSGAIESIDARLTEDEGVIGASFNALNERKLDASAYTPTDLTNYYTKSETSGATEIATALSGKQDTLVSGTNIKTINNESILGGGNIDIQGGGKAVSAGTNISITTGETADTINCTIPVSADTNNSMGVITNYNGNTASNLSFAGGYITKAKRDYSFAFGMGAETNYYYSTAIGQYTKTTCWGETAFGSYNNSVSANTNFDGSSGNTLFSVGNGINENNRHNAFEIRQNGDIYITSGGTDIKLQDNLGGGSSYTAGDGIDITNDVISVTGKVDTSAITTSVTSSSTDSQVPSAKAVNDKLGGLSLVKLTQSEYDALATKDSNVLYVIVG